MVGLFLAMFSASQNYFTFKSFYLFSLSSITASHLSLSSKIYLVFGCSIFPQLFIFSYGFERICFLYWFSLRGGVEEKKWLSLFHSSIQLLALFLFLRLTVSLPKADRFSYIFFHSYPTLHIFLL